MRLYPKNIFFIILLCINIICFDSFSQSEIKYRNFTSCDTSNLDKTIKVKTGDISCIEGGGHDYVMYFTKKEEFQNFVQKNKIPMNYCKDKPDTIMFDFNKYDVVFARIGFGGGYTDSTYVVVEKKNCYIINLNFSWDTKNVGTKTSDNQTVFQINAIQYIFSRYFLLPKGKINTPEFNVYETYKKCY